MNESINQSIKYNHPVVHVTPDDAVSTHKSVLSSLLHRSESRNRNRETQASNESINGMDEFILPSLDHTGETRPEKQNSTRKILGFMGIPFRPLRPIVRSEGFGCTLRKKSEEDEGEQTNELHVTTLYEHWILVSMECSCGFSQSRRVLGREPRRFSGFRSGAL
mmetsp:Transcript_25038/g.59084  ORF Transcript_25038/g.59084 Transcript_25038/m.59084 type:complete len:164 (+) Transcript_25038:172-663(+)